MKNMQKYLLILLAIVLVGCPADNTMDVTETLEAGPPPQMSAAPAQQDVVPVAAVVSIKDSRFVPETISIKAGDTVSWTNEDRVGHTVTGRGFDSGLLKKGQHWLHIFTEKGIYEYTCTPHPWMKGKIIVG